MVLRGMWPERAAGRRVSLADWLAGQDIREAVYALRSAR